MRVVDAQSPLHAASPLAIHFGAGTKPPWIRPCFYMNNPVLHEVPSPDVCTRLMTTGTVLSHPEPSPSEIVDVGAF